MLDTFVSYGTLGLSEVARSFQQNNFVAQSSVFVLFHHSSVLNPATLLIKNQLNGCGLFARAQLYRLGVKIIWLSWVEGTREDHVGVPDEEA
jgi:hypothetical protein